MWTKSANILVPQSLVGLSRTDQSLWENGDILLFPSILQNLNVSSDKRVYLRRNHKRSTNYYILTHLCEHKKMITVIHYLPQFLFLLYSHFHPYTNVFICAMHWISEVLFLNWFSGLILTLFTYTQYLCIRRANSLYGLADHSSHPIIS